MQSDAVRRAWRRGSATVPKAPAAARLGRSHATLRAAKLPIVSNWVVDVGPDRRGVRWFTPTIRPQASGLSAAPQDTAIGADMVDRYRKFGLQAMRQRLMGALRLHPPQSRRTGLHLDLQPLGTRSTTSTSSATSAYFSPSWTALQSDRGRDFSVIVDGVSV